MFTVRGRVCEKKVRDGEVSQGFHTRIQILHKALLLLQYFKSHKSVKKPTRFLLSGQPVVVAHVTGRLFSSQLWPSQTRQWPSRSNMNRSCSFFITPRRTRSLPPSAPGMG